MQHQVSESGNKAENALSKDFLSTEKINKCWICVSRSGEGYYHRHHVIF